VQSALARPFPWRAPLLVPYPPSLLRALGLPRALPPLVLQQPRPSRLRWLLQSLLLRAELSRPACCGVKQKATVSGSKRAKGTDKRRMPNPAGKDTARKLRECTRIYSQRSPQRRCLWCVRMSLNRLLYKVDAVLCQLNCIPAHPETPTSASETA
jgi:hypothetical protein